MTFPSNQLPKYKYRSKDLFRVLVEVGFSKNHESTEMKLYRLIRSGKFTPPTIGNNRWAFTEDQLIDIAKSFSPGGKGEWHFDMSSV